MKDKINIITFIDTETTGLDPKVHEIVQIGLVKIKESRTGDKIVHKLLSELELKIKPSRIELADPIALKINKYSEESWEEAITATEALSILQTELFDPDPQELKINRVIVAGHNVHFDVLMVTSFFARQGISWSPRHSLDTYTLARKTFIGDLGLESYALGSICNYYGIENGAAHTALSDARACLAIYQRMMGVDVAD